MKTLLIADFKNLLIRGLTAVPPFSHGDMFTGGLYGFLLQMGRYIREHDPTHLIVVDDQKPYLRREVYPAYKGDRGRPGAPTPSFLSGLKESMDYCYDLLQRTKIPLVKVQGWEADDHMANLCKKCTSFDKIILISNDSDLMQLFRHPNVILDRGKRGIYTKADFDREWGISLEDFWKIGALAGTHNAIPQLLPKCREKTALKIVKDPARWKEVWNEHKEELALRQLLIELPFALPLSDNPLDYHPEVYELKRPEFLTNNIIDFLERTYAIRMTEGIEIALERLSHTINVLGAD